MGVELKKLKLQGIYIPLASSMNASMSMTKSTPIGQEQERNLLLGKRRNQKIYSVILMNEGSRHEWAGENGPRRKSIK